MAIQALPRPITVAEYYQMLDEGILHEDDRVELIEGELHWMAALRSPHAACVKFLGATFNQRLAQQAVVGVQDPIHLDDHSEPEPDLILARWRDDYYRAAHPTPADLLLVVEVSDTTARYDRQKKAPLYAGQGIPEYWIVNIPQQVVDVYSDPQDGRYRQRSPIRRGGQVAPQAFPACLISVDELFG